MDFGLTGLDSFVDSTESDPSPTPHHSETTNLKSLRSGLVHDEWTNPNIPKAHSSASKTMQSFPLLRSNASMVSSDGRQMEHMLSFSSVKSQTSLQSKDSEAVPRNTHNSIFPYPQHKSRNTGFVCGSYSGGMHGIRGPFTQSQWIELEHQALIYKYLSSNVPVPSNLLIPLKKTLYPYALTCSSAGSLPPNTRWGSFHLGFSGNADPEPGRCRRTDGKKWRCSRDAVADQKYCERHINRGRHRSRKPVESQTGHSAPGTTNPTAMVATMTTSLSSTVMPSGGTSNNKQPIIQHQLKSLHPGAASSPSVNAPVNRLLNKETVCRKIQESEGLSMMASTLSHDKSGAKQEISLGESTQSEFGLVFTDSLLNPSQRGSYVNPKSYEDSFLIFNDHETQDQDQHPLRQFFEDWPKDQSSHQVSWPEEFKSDWTQLSMSIPMSDFSSSSSSPTQEKLGQSPLRLSRELEQPIQMNLGVSRNDDEQLVSWGSSMGGPLGEALTNGSSCVKPSKVPPPSLNLLAEGWNGGQLGSSPTCVLQKATFCSLSNSS